MNNTLEANVAIINQGVGPGVVVGTMVLVSNVQHAQELC